ncbi:MAG: BatD family protein [Desulfobacula sp.]|nr:BatD family protein [Desulfobacula sp.]
MKKTGRDMKLKALIFAALALLLVIPAQAFCFEVTARVDKNRVTPEDSVLLRIEISGGKADPDLSGITDFKVTPRGTSSSYQFINGKSQSTSSYQFILTPLKQGQLRIPAIKVVQDGETAFTQEIFITVSEEQAVQGEVKALFARAEISNEKLFMGQPGVYSLKFFTSKRLSGLGFDSPPGFKGFSVKPVEKENTYTQTLNGILFQVTQVDYVLFPTEPGTFTIDPAVLVANVMVQSNRNSGTPSFFNDPFFSSDSFKPVRVRSNPVTIEVAPLPAYQGTNPFSGLVGRFNIEAAMDKTSLKAGESATLTLTLSGSGNIMDANPPAMDIDPNFKVYDDNPVESLNLTEKGYEGEKIFKKALVPVDPGHYTIPSIVLVYFDAEEQAYKEVSTPEIPLTVTPSGEVHTAETPETKVSGNFFVTKEEVGLINQDIFDIKEGLEVLTPYQDLSPLAFVILILAPAVLFSGVTAFVRIRKKEDSIETIMQKKAKSHLIQAGKLDVTDEVFLSRLYSSLVAGILAKARKKGETLTLEEARAILTHTGADKDLMDAVAGLLEKIESARFGKQKIDAAEGKSLLSDVGRVIRILSLVFLCLGVFSFSGQRAMAADPGATFIDAVRQYKVKNYTEAAKAFESLAAGPVKHPYLYYNTGNAYLKAGDPGRAVLWYERAKILIPNDPDLAFNLDYAMAQAKDKTESSPEISEILFFWDRLFPARTLQITAVLFSFVFFAWASVRVIQNRKIFSGTGTVLCVAFVLITMMTAVQYYQRAFCPNAVIVQKEVAVRAGTADTATILFSLHAGTKVRVEDRREEYLKIRFSKDRVGWVKTVDAIVI